jgi:phage terminase large subunit-like protein
MASYWTTGRSRAWAREAVAAYNIHQADRLVAESNQGGEMVSITIGTILGAPPVTLVHASRGKHTRAEPVSSKYEQGMVHHVGTFAALEDELCTWVPGDASPNRLDALVWALSDLMLGTSEGVFF